MDQAEVEQPFNIRAGETKDVTAILEAGVLVVSAPGAKDIKVFAAKKDIQGERKQFGYGFDERASDDAAGRRLRRRRPTAATAARSRKRLRRSRPASERK